MTPEAVILLQVLGLDKDAGPQDVRTTAAHLKHTWSTERFLNDPVLKAAAQEKLGQVDFAQKRLEELNPWVTKKGPVKRSVLSNKTRSSDIDPITRALMIPVEACLSVVETSCRTVVRSGFQIGLVLAVVVFVFQRPENTVRHVEQSIRQGLPSPLQLDAAVPSLDRPGRH